MKQYNILMLIMLAFLIVGCEKQDVFMIGSGKNNATIGYDESSLISFDVFVNNCSVVQVTNTNASGVCGGKKNVLTTYNDNNFNVTCCDLTSSCSYQNQTDYVDLCNYNPNDSISIQSLFVDSQWINMCCDLNTGHCYNLNNVNIADNSTCPLNYVLVMIAPNYNESYKWNANCCNFGGLN